MAEILTDIVFKPLAEKLCKDFMFVKNLHYHSESSQGSMAIIKAIVLDANSSGSLNNTQKEVMRKLEDVLTQWDYYLDKKATRALQKQVLGGKRLATEARLFFSPSNQLLVQLKDAREVKTIKGALDTIAKDCTQLATIVNILPQSRSPALNLETGPQPMTDIIVGRNQQKDNIINMLCNSFDCQESLSAVAIVGIGGQGKTTLAQYVYNDERVKGCFEVRLWVYCTPDSTVREVLEKIVACATGDKPSNNCEMVQLQNWISQAVVGKRFVLVLDNVWEQDYLSANWLALRALLGVGANGSKVLVTTRNEKVARIMSPLNDPYMLNDLGEDDSWKLFVHFAFNGRQELGVEAIGEMIFDIIPKVPLVIRVVGQHLAESYTVQQWRDFKDALAANSSFKGRDMIMQTLKLSYDKLDEKLKLCVAYCSLFPKGWDFDTDKMIRLWTALGYVKSGNRCLEDVGEEYVCHLVSSGFFSEFKGLWMHDVIHDLILSIAHPKYQMVDSKTNDIDERVCHVSFYATNVCNLDVTCLESTIAQQLQSILMLVSEPSYIRFPHGWHELSRFGGLKVLDLHDLSLKKVPHSVGALVHLRYLDLSQNPMRKLPNSITQLVNLLSLDLSNCKILEELPRDMRKLVKLRHLLLYGCDRLSYMPKGLGKLKELRTLYWFVVGESRSESSRSKGSAAGGLTELSDLNNLKGWLRIIVDRESKYIAAEAKTAQLKMKKQLTALIIDFKKSGKEDYMVLEALQPHGPNLKNLSIENYGGEKLPDWIGTLNSLITLLIYNCQQLDKLSDSIGNLTSLKSLYISNCPRLESLPHQISNLSQLNKLDISKCPKALVERCRNPTGEYWPHIKHIERVRIGDKYFWEELIVKNKRAMRG